MLKARALNEQKYSVPLLHYGAQEEMNIFVPVVQKFFVIFFWDQMSLVNWGGADAQFLMYVRQWRRKLEQFVTEFFHYSMFSTFKKNIDEWTCDAMLGSISLWTIFILCLHVSRIQFSYVISVPERGFMGQLN